MLSRLLALAAGAACVFAFAPFEVPLVEIAALSALFVLWWNARTARDAAWIGFFFGGGLFGARTSWVYIALETFGGMPTLAAILATAVFVTCSSAWPALA